MMTECMMCMEWKNVSILEMCTKIYFSAQPLPMVISSLTSDAGFLGYAERAQSMIFWWYVLARHFPLRRTSLFSVMSIP